MAEYESKMYCCCSLRDRCLLLAGCFLGLFATGSAGYLAIIFILITFPEPPQLAMNDEVNAALDMFFGVSIFGLIVCTLFVIVIIGLIVGILRRRRGLLLVYLVVFGIHIAFMFLSSFGVLIQILAKGMVFALAVLFLQVAFLTVTCWCWWSVLLLRREMTYKGGQMKMSLIKAKPFTDAIDVESDPDES